jgi:hypothetical protein
MTKEQKEILEDLDLLLYYFHTGGPSRAMHYVGDVRNDDLKRFLTHLGQIGDDRREEMANRRSNYGRCRCSCDDDD